MIFHGAPLYIFLCLTMIFHGALIDNGFPLCHDRQYVCIVLWLIKVVPCTLVDKGKSCNCAFKTKEVVSLKMNIRINMSFDQNIKKSSTKKTYIPLDDI